jgi:protein phosphatase
MPPALLTPQRDLTVAAKDLGNNCFEIIPTRFPGSPFIVSMFQHMGDRRTQEDRYTVAPNILPSAARASGGNQNASFLGVFDGTVGDFTSDNVKDIILPKLLESAGWNQFWAARESTLGAKEQDRLLEGAVREMYINSDQELLTRCAGKALHYATSTSVTLLMVNDILVVGHLGDSRIAFGMEEEGGMIRGEQMTQDHKPDLEFERRRIEHSGGMVERLTNHNNKPFIRGGDFLMRKALGEQPMQLQYSRAFGCKDLKMFGLSCEPDVTIIRAGSEKYRRIRFAVLASDGLWDVVTANESMMIVSRAIREGLPPAQALVRVALDERQKRKTRADNVTAIVVQFD